MKLDGLYDYHCHSTVSFDGRVSLMEACEEASLQGMRGITFTEHWEEAYIGGPKMTVSISLISNSCSPGDPMVRVLEASNKTKQ